MANFMSGELAFRMFVTFILSMLLVNFCSNFYFQFKINNAQMRLTTAQMELNKSQAAVNKAQAEFNDSILRLTLAIKDNQHIVKGP